MTSTRHKTRRRQVMGIPPTLVMMGIASRIEGTDAPAEFTVST